MKASRVSLALVCFASVLMVFCMTGYSFAAPRLESISVTPVNPSIAVGLMEQFTAIGTYKDHTTQDITTLVNWSSSNVGIATISNVPGSNGLATSVSVGSTTITATDPTTSISGTAPLKVILSLPKTGQTISYYIGDDGDSQRGVVWPIPRFTTNADTTVADNLTGLVWAPDGGTPTVGTCTGGTKSWQGALDYVACLNANSYLGYSDWRLPNLNELESLVHAGYTQETCSGSSCTSNAAWLNTLGFANAQETYYWPSTSGACVPTTAWVIDMVTGSQSTAHKDGIRSVWPVRSGQGDYAAPAPLPKTGQTICYDSIGAAMDCAGTGQDGELLKGIAWPSPRFTTNADTTVADNLTGLVVAPDGGTPTVGTCTGGTKTWQDALDYVACLNVNNYLGHADWRLPNRKELRSLTDYSNCSSALPSGHPFTNVLNSDYWLSTSFAADSTRAWFVDMYSGPVAHLSKTISLYLYAWPVRAGQ